MPLTARRVSHATSRHPLARLGAGAFAGLVGGLVFGVLMAVPAVTGGFGGTGMMTRLGRVIGTDSLPLLWTVHLLASALFGALFSLAVAPRRGRRTVLLAVGWGFALWLFGSFLALRILTGEGLGFDVAAAYNLLGHLVYGVVLGVAYAAVFREEMDVIRDHPTQAARRRSAP